MSILPTDTLSDLTERVGVNNIDQILADNGLKRSPNIGKQWAAKIQKIQQEEQNVPPTKKVAILNQFVSNSDIYEEASLASEDTWKVLKSLNSFPDYLYISDQLASNMPDSYLLLGNGISIGSKISDIVTTTILNSEDVDPSIFSTVTNIQDLGLVSRNSDENAQSNPMNWFNIPLDKITLYSSLTGGSINIPAYPEEYSDERVANYTTMPDLLYQYEPWQMYQSSGPRSNTFEFHLHRDMWTGNHTDGKANDLIRFCEAQCYPIYNGSSVVSPTVTLYVNGSALITGIMTNVGVNWSGPIGHDGWYLEFTLSLTIVEVSTTTLDHSAVLSKGLIG